MCDSTDRPEGDTDPRALQGTALRYAAGELPHAEASSFESRLAEDQQARDALAEAVRLSAAALGQSPPVPDRSFRAMIRERLRPMSPWIPGWWDRRAYRGHPLAWTTLGAGVVAAATIIGLWLVQHDSATNVVSMSEVDSATPSGEMAAVGLHTPISVTDPADTANSTGTEPPVAACDSNSTAPRAAEIWADLSTPDHLEKDHEDEFRLRNRLRDLQILHPAKPYAAGAEPRDP